MYKILESFFFNSRVFAVYLCMTPSRRQRSFNKASWWVQGIASCTEWATKRNPEMGETAIQPEPGQTANLSKSGLHSVAPPCIHFIKETKHKG